MFAFCIITTIVLGLTRQVDDEIFDFASLDSSDSEHIVDRIFGAQTGAISKREAMNVLLSTYADTTMKEIGELEKKIKLGRPLDNIEEEKIFLKSYLTKFFNERPKDEEITTEKLKEMMKNNEVIAYIEEKVKREEFEELHGDEDAEVDD